MVSHLVVGIDLSLDLESEAFFFRVVLGSEGLRSEGGCVFGFLAKTEGLDSHEEEGSFLLVGSLG